MTSQHVYPCFFAMCVLENSATSQLQKFSMTTVLCHKSMVLPIITYTSKLAPYHTTFTIFSCLHLFYGLKVNPTAPWTYGVNDVIQPIHSIILNVNMV